MQAAGTISKFWLQTRSQVSHRLRATRSMATCGMVQDKVAVVTGGASGIGEAAVRKFAKEGAKVVIADMQLDKARKLASELGEGNALAVECNVCKEEDIERMVKEAVKHFGSLDVMVANAGMAWSSDQTGQLMENMDTEEWDKLISTDLRSVALTTKHAAREMKKNVKAGRPGGCIINMASVAGLRVNCTAAGNPVLMHAGYTAAKHGVVALTELAACELAPYHIRVNAVAPGFVATPLVAALLFGDINKPQAEVEADLAKSKEHSPTGVALVPEDIANSMVFLASDMARCINGVTLRIDNGMVIGVAGYVPGLEV